MGRERLQLLGVPCIHNLSSGAIITVYQGVLYHVRIVLCTYQLFDNLYGCKCIATHWLGFSITMGSNFCVKLYVPSILLIGKVVGVMCNYYGCCQVTVA